MLFGRLDRLQSVNATVLRFVGYALPGCMRVSIGMALSGALLASGVWPALAAPPAAGDLEDPMALSQKLDTANSDAGFVVRVAWVRYLPGSFDYVEGVISRQPQRATLSIDVRLAAQSLTMPNADHAAWAQSEEFFDAQKYPWIRFNAEGVPEALLVTGGDLTGELSLRGQTRRVTLEVTPAACAKPGTDCPVIVQGELQRSDFGMQARRFVVADKVRLNLSIRVRDGLTKP